MKLYEKLKLLREEKGITQDKLIKDTGLSAQAIRNYENPEWIDFLIPFNLKC